MAQKYSKKGFSADNEALYYIKDKEEQAKKQKSSNGIVSASFLENSFKVFTIGAFLLGVPVVAGLFAAALASFIAYKGYKHFSEKKKNALEATKEAFKAVKENSQEELPEKDSKYLDVAKNKDKEPATKEEFIKNVKDSAKEFINSKEGKEALENKAFNNMFEKATGMSFKELSTKIDELEKHSDLADEKVTEEVTIEDKEKVEEIKNDYPKKEEIEDVNIGRESRTSIDAPNPASDGKLMDIPDSEFEKEVASKEDIAKEAKALELEKNAIEKETNILNQ